MLPKLWFGALLPSIVLAFGGKFGHRKLHDVVIIGGGSAGTYTAVRLQQEGKTVALIEQQSKLGGHVDTYYDPLTGKAVDYGVVIFQNITVVRDYLEYLDIPTGPASLGGDSKTLDVQTGQVVTIDAGAVIAGLLEALPRFQAQQAQYPYLDNGFNLPAPVPEDLLLPFGDWLQKYNLSNVAYTLWQYNQGSGNILAQPTLYVLKYSNRDSISNLATAGYIQTVKKDNQEIYDHALEKLADSTYLSSKVLRVHRSPRGVEVTISTPDGEKFIEAKELVIAIPPKSDNLKFLDLNQEEFGLFRQFNNSYYWDAIIRNTGLPVNTSIAYIDSQAANLIPAQPLAYVITATGISNLHTLQFGSATYLSDAEVQELMTKAIQSAVQSLGLPQSNDLKFEGFNSHSPFLLTVCPEAIRDGFYGRAEALQGKRNTWYTGAAWQAQDSSAIWNFTEEVVLPRLLKALE